jgi:ion channel
MPYIIPQRSQGAAQRMIRRTIKPILLGLSIFVMAGVYELMWVARPDYFRVQSGVNVLPLELAQIALHYSAYSDKKPLPELPAWRGEAEAVERIEKTYQQFQLASAHLAAKESEFEVRQEQDASDYKPFENLQWSQYELFVAQKTAPFVAQLTTIKDRMQDMLTASGVSDPLNLQRDSRNAYFSLDVQRARLELRKAMAESDAREHGMRHLTGFQQQPSQKEYVARRKELEDLRNSIWDEQSVTNKIHGDVYDAFLDYRRAVISRLGYWDFLYFSVGAATTATFGDISPNSTPVRLLVCLQVLGSIVFIGLMVSQLASRRSALGARD